MNAVATSLERRNPLIQFVGQSGLIALDGRQRLRRLIDRAGQRRNELLGDGRERTQVLLDACILPHRGVVRRRDAVGLANRRFESCGECVTVREE